MKQFTILLSAVAFLMLGDFPAFAGTTTLTTYYPAPDGNYNHLTANNVGIGQAIGTETLDVTLGGGDVTHWTGYFQNASGPYGIYVQNTAGNAYDDIAITTTGGGNTYNYGIISNGTIQTIGPQPANYSGIFENTTGADGLYVSSVSAGPTTYVSQLATGVYGLTTNGIISTSTDQPTTWAGVFENTGGSASGGPYGILSNGIIDTTGAIPTNWAGIFENTSGPYGIYTQNSTTGNDGNPLYSELGNSTFGVETNGNVYVSQNGYEEIGQAYLSSGGDYAHLANNEYYNSSSGWVENGNVGELLQLTGQVANFYSHDASGNHTLQAQIENTYSYFINTSGYYTYLVDGANGVNTNGYVYSSNGGYASYLGDGADGLSTNGLVVAVTSQPSNWAGIFENTGGTLGLYADSNNHTDFVELANTAGSGYAVYTNGNMYAGGIVYAASDARLKENIMPIAGALDKVQLLNGVSFTWKKGGKKDIGVLAQNVEKVFPELVTTGPDGIKATEYGNLSALLIEAVKEQQKEIKDQQKEIDELKQKLGENK